MGVVSSVSVIFDTGNTYSCSSNKGDFVKLEEKTSPRNIKGIAKTLEISRFGIVEYSVRSESGRIIALQGSGILCSWVTKVFAHNFPTGNL